MKNIVEIIGRQGDILVTRIRGTAPPTAQPLKRERDGYIVAHGEATGHRHRVPSRSIRSFVVDEQGTSYMDLIGGPTKLLHEEHDPIVLKPIPGTVIAFQRQLEYSPEAVRRVED